MEANWKVLRMKSLVNGKIVDAMVQINVSVNGESENGIINYVHENDAEEKDFIPFNEITEEKIIEWAKEKHNDGKEVIDRTIESINKRIERKEKRKESVNTLPWNSKDVE